MSPSDLYHRLGGLAGVSRIVLAMYDRVLASERLEPFFRHVDMRRLVEHQSNFVASLIGGPDSYTDEELKAVHSGLDIDTGAFAEMLAQLRAAVVEQGLAEEDIEALMRSFEAREPCIVTGRKGPGSRVA